MTERTTIFHPRPRRPATSGIAQPPPADGLNCYRFTQEDGARLIVYATRLRTAWHRLHQAWMLGQVDMVNMVHDGMGEPDDGHDWRRIT